MTFSNAINWLRRDGPRWENLSITYSAGTGLFSVAQANGSALSTLNCGFVTIPSRANPGQQTVYRITANQTFTDDNGTSTIIGNLFGLTTGIAYAQDLPFWVYAVANDAETAVSFMISRYPCATVSPASTSIGKTGSAIADTQGAFFALDDPTVTDYDANPCVCIGAFRMRMSAADDWTVQTLSNGSGFGTGFFVGADGIGQFHDESKFQMATGQFGAATNSFWKANGGTAPVFVNKAASFYIRRNGTILYFCNMTDTTGGGGVGAVTAQLALPYVSSDGTCNCAVGQFTNATPTAFGCIGSIADNSNNVVFINFDAATFATLQNASFTAGAASVFNSGFTYQPRYT